MEVEGVLTSVSIEGDWEVGRIADLTVRAVQVESCVTLGGRSSDVQLSTGYAIELRYPGDVAIGATIITQGDGKIAALLDKEGWKSDYGDYPMHAANAFEVGNSEILLRPDANNADRNALCIPADLSLIVSYKGVSLRSHVAGPNWTMAVDEPVAAFRWVPARKP